MKTIWNILDEQRNTHDENQIRYTFINEGPASKPVVNQKQYYTCSFSTDKELPRGLVERIKLAGYLFSGLVPPRKSFNEFTYSFMYDLGVCTDIKTDDRYKKFESILKRRNSF